MLTRLFFACILLASTGCGGHPPAVETPVSVSGKITAADGKPFGNVTLNLQPLENGYMQEIEVKPDGSYTVAATPGRYAYFLTPKRGARSRSSQLAPYSAPSLERIVVVAPEQPADIELP